MAIFDKSILKFIILLSLYNKMIYIIKNIMSIAIDAPDLLDNAKFKIKNWLGRFSQIKDKSKECIKDILICDKPKNKSVYEELLRNIIDTIHEKDYQNNISWENSEFNFTKDGRWIRFWLDDPIIQKTLNKYDFLKSWNNLDIDRIKERLKTIHEEWIHHRVARFSLIKFNEDWIPYLDFDPETWSIVIKKDIKLAWWKYMETKWWNSFMN